jgi:hypothetical protein
MKVKVIQLLALIFMGTSFVFAQDVPESEVPSVIVNSFKKEFPKARDVEWELKGDQYNVEFEIGFFSDYEAWFDSSGKLLKYTEEISKSDLPEAVKETIKSQFAGYRIDDAEKIVENGVETYEVEIEKKDDERKLVFTKDGTIL